MKKTSLVMLIAGFVVFGVCDTAQSQKPSQQKPPKLANQPQPALRPIGSGRQRVSREKQTITIFRGSQNIVANQFTELMIARTAYDFSVGARKADPQRLNGLTVSFVRDAEVPDRWNIYPGGASDGEGLILAENVFRIQRVIPSTEKDQVRVQIDGRVYSLLPGEVLLLLG